MKIHEDNECMCDVCEKICKNKVALKDHKKIHSKPVECTLCQKTFLTKVNLNKQCEVVLSSKTKPKGKPPKHIDMLGKRQLKRRAKKLVNRFKRAIENNEAFKNETLKLF